MKKMDPRVIRTRNTFKEEFIHLIKQKGYRSVTVSEVIELAGFNRATFYAHFKDKEHLKEILIHDELDGLENAFRSPFEPTGYVNFENMSVSSVKVFSYIKEHANFFDLLIEYENIPGLEEALVYMIHQSFLNSIEFISPSSAEVNEQQFQIYRAYGIFGVIKEWVKSGYAVSVEEISQQLIFIMKSSPIGAIAKKEA
ncbi:TetR/AcrR family transcriptional regulator [Mesobacillus maritimus]|uniref:TetR/AcrR family transcriptional regulator n=1 Tax=Mesobacillus maritimus TaxID=1643336 RepID=UPI002041DD63|nr:TetR/AcrR family transcriptional regulator [Mesobacillus maritimus]MCM3672104.1 TetR/AcrR family transcriptional regulator [Mesobacillus maritimus]